MKVSTENKWYVIRAVSGQESKIKDYIMAEINRLGFSSNVEDIIVPTEKVIQIRKGKKTSKEVIASTMKLAKSMIAIALATQGASKGLAGIGLAIAKEFLMNGAEVVLLEKNSINIKNTPTDIANNCTIIKCDVTNSNDVNKAILKIVDIYGGIDIMVSNAGAAWQGEIGKVNSKILKESFDLNFYAHQYLSQACIDIMLKQQTGGVLLFNITKQAINPGNNFGPYGIPKASTLFLMRQYTLEYGKFGIRSNGVNPDRIRSGLVSDKMIASRSKARNVSEKEYMSGNLLKEEVLAEDVGKAFLSLALAKKTTGDVMTVDGGNIQAVLR